MRHNWIRHQHYFSFSISSNFQFSLHSSSTPSLFGSLSSVPPWFIKHYNFLWFQSLQILVILNPSCTLDSLEGIFKYTHDQRIPGGLVVRIQHFHCCGQGSVPGWGTKILQATQQDIYISPYPWPELTPRQFVLISLGWDLGNSVFNHLSPLLVSSRHSLNICYLNEWMDDERINEWMNERLRVPWTERRSNKSVLKELNIHWKDCCWSWSSNTLATWCKELTHRNRPWCWERLNAKEAGGRGDG